MTSYTRTIAEGSGGYVGLGYTSEGYVAAQTTMADTLAKSYGAKRTASQTVTITGLIPNLFIGRAISQTLTNVNAVARKLVATRELSAGAGGYTVSGYQSGGYLTRDITQITDVLTKVRSVNRTLTETINNTNAVARIYKALRTITPALTLTDTLGRTYAALRTLTQTVTSVNSVTRLLVATRTIIETSTITETIVAFKGIAGVGARRIFTASAAIFKRTGVTTIFKRSANTSG